MLGYFVTKKGMKYGDEIADFVEKEFNKRRTERMPFELQWRLNIEFINGNQYLDINPVSMSIEEVPKLFWYQEREVFNQIATITETRIARLSRTKPIPKVRPASDDDSDISSAKVSTKLLSSSWHDQDMNSKYDDFVSWLEVTGSAFWKPVWNKFLGRVVFMGLIPDPNKYTDDNKDTSTGELPKEVNQSLGEGQQIVELHEGDIDTTVVSPFEIYPDNCFRDSLRDCRSIIHARAYHVDVIEEMWGVKVDPEPVDVMTMQKSASSMGGLGYGVGTFRTGLTSLKNHAIVKEYYEKPSKRFPEGRFIVSANKKTLFVGVMPYMIGKDGERDFPFEMAVSIKIPGQFFGKSVVERCIPIQRRYNAVRNRKAEYLNLVAIGQWYKPYGSVDDDTDLNNEPGAVITFNPAMGRPEPVQFPSLPGSFENEIETLLAEFTAVSGVSELSRMSEAPSGVKSGVALSIANEQDDTRISVTSQRIAASVVGLGRKWIRLWRQFVSEPRVLRSVGDNMDVEVTEWTASDLRSDDVIIENESALSETHAQRRQMVFDLLAAGLFVRPEMSQYSPETRQKIFELLEFGHWEYGASDENDLQKKRARRENKQIMQGIPIQINDFDDDAIHIEQHNRVRMLPEYETVLKSPVGPVVDRIMRLHIAMHMQRRAQLLAQQQQSMAQQKVQAG